MYQIIYEKEIRNITNVKTGDGYLRWKRYVEKSALDSNHCYYLFVENENGNLSRKMKKKDTAQNIEVFC